MNIALRRPLTVPEYLAWAETQSERQRTELINGQIVSMSPERAEHNRPKGRIYVALLSAFRASPLAGEVFTDGMTVVIDSHTAYEPDALVQLGPVIAAGDVTVSEPFIVVEVLSPTTKHTDTSAKLVGYFRLPSVQHYLIVDPETMTVAHHARGADGAIVSSTYASGVLHLDPPGLNLDLNEILHNQ